jgi:hypothetical protein
MTRFEFDTFAVFSSIVLSLGFSTLRFEESRQPGTVTVTVFDSLSRNPLPNADVADLASGQNRITDENGRAYLQLPSSGKLQLRVRQIGYQPRRVDFTGAPPGNAVNVALERVAYVLETVQSTGRCSTDVDSAMSGVSAIALGQLKQAAEKYNEFRRVYPFEATIERRTAAVPGDGDIKRMTVSEEKFGSEKFEVRYRPGHVIEGRFGEFLVPILFISTLADSVFWNHHCFAARSFESYKGARVIRLEFEPTADVDGPDYKGAALLDSATSMLLRVEFELANPPRRNGPRKLDGYTTFMSPSPFVVLPDTTGAEWWLRTPDTDEHFRPDYVQVLFMKDVTYKKGKPPGYSESK